MTDLDTYATDYPFHFGADGLTARTSRTDHIRDLIEQLLFTRQGERLTRPTLGCGLPDLLFAPLGDATVTAAQMTIRVAIQQFLSAQIELVALDVRAEDSALLIDIAYRILATGDEASLSLKAEVAS